MSALPSCMMPDGAEPCEAFLELQADNKRLRAALVELDKLMDFDAPALSCNCFRDPSGLNAAMAFARRALDGEKG